MLPEISPLQAISRGWPEEAEDREVSCRQAKQRAVKGEASRRLGTASRLGYLLVAASRESVICTMNMNYYMRTADSESARGRGEFNRLRVLQQSAESVATSSELWFRSGAPGAFSTPALD